MKKKLLLSQNVSFFAELERKGTEIKTLEIKLEDSEKSFNELQIKYDLLEAKYKEATSDLKEQEILIEELKSKITELKAASQKVSLPVITMDTPLTEIQKEILTATPAEKEAETTLPDEKYTIPEVKVPPATKAETASPLTYEELKAEGLKAIGEITRLSARKIAELSGDKATDDLKNLILGNNEGFKQDILLILENKNPTLLDEVKIMELLDKAKEYIAGVK